MNIFNSYKSTQTIDNDVYPIYQTLGAIILCITILVNYNS